MRIETHEHTVHVEAPSIAEALRLAYETCREHRWHPVSISVLQVEGPESEHAIEHQEGGWWTTGIPRRT